MTVKQLINKLKKYPNDFDICVIDDNNPLEQEFNCSVSKIPPSGLNWEAKHNGAIPDDGKTVYIKYFNRS